MNEEKERDFHNHGRPCRAWKEEIEQGGPTRKSNTCVESIIWHNIQWGTIIVS